MRTPLRAVPLVLVALLAAAPASAKPATSSKAFKFKGSKLEIGAVYRYEQSDLEGNRPASVLVHVAAKDRVEVVRSEPGSGRADSFVIEVDWDRGGSPARYERWISRKDGGQSRAYTVTFGDGDGTAVFGPEDLKGFRSAGVSGPVTVAFDQYPVHSLDTLLATLNVAMRFLADPTKEFEIGLLADAPDPATGAPLVYKGKAKVTFLEDVDRDGKECRKYRIAGPATGEQEGFLWVHKEQGHLVDLELPVPMLPDQKDAHLSFQGTEAVDETGWSRVKAAEIAKALK